jgi:hypothetical protein
MVTNNNRTLDRFIHSISSNWWFRDTFRKILLAPVFLFLFILFALAFKLIGIPDNLLTDFSIAAVFIVFAIFTCREYLRRKFFWFCLIFISISHVSFIILIIYVFPSLIDDYGWKVIYFGEFCLPIFMISIFLLGKHWLQKPKAFRPGKDNI